MSSFDERHKRVLKNDGFVRQILDVGDNFQKAECILCKRDVIEVVKRHMALTKQKEAVPFKLR